MVNTVRSHRAALPKVGNGRPPIGLDRMLRIDFTQHRFKLADLFAKVGQELQVRGFKINTGTIVDATIICAPSSTKNADKARDPEMRQTKRASNGISG